MVVAVVTVIGGTALWILSAAERRWSEMRVQALQLLREEQARPAARPILRGTPVPGNAWDCYDAALGVVKAIPEEDRRALDTFYSYCRTQWHAVPNRRIVDPLLLRLGPALRHLQAGAIRSEAWFHARGSDGTLLKSVDVFAIFRLVYLAEMQARGMADDGRGREAADLLLDLAQLGRDGLFAESPGSPSGWYLCLDNALDQLRRLILSNLLTAADLLEVERGLEVLDQSSRRFLPVEASQVMKFGFEFLEAEDLSAAVREPFTDEGFERWKAWRFGFSDRMMVADAFDEGMGYARKCAPLQGASWSQVRQMVDLLERDVAASRNPVVRKHLQHRIYRVSVQLPLARLRLLRVAAHYKATGEFLDLEDPYGGMLRRAEDACRWRIWSVGYDGVDNGGWSDWGTRYTPLVDVALLMDR